MWTSLWCRIRRVKMDVFKTSERRGGTEGVGHTTEEKPEPNPEVWSDRFDHTSERVGMGGGSQVRVRCREGGREEHSRERKAYRTACRCQWGSTRGPVWGTASCSVICCPGHKWKHVGRWGLESWCVWWGAGYRIVSRTATRSDSTSTSGIVKCGAWSGGVRGSTQWAQREGSSCNYQRKWFRLLKM